MPLNAEMLSSTDDSESSSTERTTPSTDEPEMLTAHIVSTYQPDSSIVQQTDDILGVRVQVLMMGEVGVGKTSIINRYVYGAFTSAYHTTAKADNTVKIIDWDNKTQVRLYVLDIPYEGRLTSLVQRHYRRVNGGIIVFDVTRTASRAAVPKWKHYLDSKVTSQDTYIPCVLLANKCAAQKNGKLYDAKELDDCCLENGIDTWFETSARYDINIRASFSYLLSKILDVEKTYIVISRTNHEKQRTFKL